MGGFGVLCLKKIQTTHLETQKAPPDSLVPSSFSHYSEVRNSLVLKHVECFSVKEEDIIPAASLSKD